MTNQTKPTGAQPFVAFENALEVIESLKSVVAMVKRHSPRVAQQIVDSASSVAANLAEGSQRAGRDQLFLSGGGWQLEGDAGSSPGRAGLGLGREQRSRTHARAARPQRPPDLEPHPVAHPDATGRDAFLPVV